MINKKQYIILSFLLTRVLFLGGGISLLIGISNNTLMLNSFLGMLLGYFLLYLFYKKGSINKLWEIIIAIFTLSIVWLGDTILTSTYLLYNTPPFLILIILVIVSLFGIKKEMKVIGRSSEIFIGFSFIVYFFMLISLPSLINLNNLLPFFKTNFTSFIKGIIVFTGASLTPNLMLLKYKDNLKFKDVSIGYILGCLSIIFVIFVILGIYDGDFASILRFPEYLILKKINILDYISNVENILIMEWIINIIIGSLFCSKVLKDDLNKRSFVLILIGIFILVNNFLNKNYIYILYVKAYSYYIFFGTILLSLIWKGRKR